MRAGCALVNGKWNSHIDLGNRGLAYGDGVFTTARITMRRPQFWEAHRRRLKRDCAQLALEVDWAALEHEVATVCDDAPEPAALKITITRRAGERGYRPPPGEAVRIVQRLPLEPHPRAYVERGIAVTVCRMRLASAPALAGVKHLNRLEQVLARLEWGDEYQEGLMLDDKGYVVEGTMSNLFAVADKQLLTPLLDRCGVAGVMRERIIAHAEAAGLRLHETRLVLEDLYRANGVFVCNALIGAWPVVRIDRQSCIKPEFIAERFKAIRKIAEGRNG